MKRRILTMLQRISSKLFFSKIEADLSQLKTSVWQINKHLEQMHERELRASILSTTPQSLLRYGFSVYSQNDEDGLIQYIFEKLAIHFPNFIEFGVGPTENNSLFLLMKGSKGVWVDGNTANYKHQINNDRLKMVDTFVTLDNVASIVSDAAAFIGVDLNGIDFISMDLDGNDYYFVEKIISKSLPKLFCVEYNGKFRNAAVKMQYDSGNSWKGDDYFGCSLMAYNDLLKENYTLLVCNITGANAFFIRNDLKSHFDILEPDALYQPPRYYFSSMYKGHEPSYRYLNKG